MSRSIRYGIIGTGMMGLEHILNINIIPDAEVTAVADPHPRSLEWAGHAAKQDVRAYSDHRQMLKEAPIDVVIIATPNFTHASILKDVFQTDKHILCEKPLCTTFDDCRWVVEAAERHHALFWVGMEYRYMPPVTRFIAEVQGGAAGKVKMLSIREHRLPFLKKVDDWNRFNRNTGGTLVEKSCHHFDLMRHVLPAEPVRVFASGGMDVNHLDEVYNGERPDILDNALVIVDFDNGVRAMFDLCMFAEASQHSQELAATGDEGKVECLIPDSVVVVGRRNPRSVETIPVSIPEAALKAGSHHGASYFQHLDFEATLREGKPAKVSAWDGLMAVTMGLAAQRSIEEGRPVMMSEFGL
jgi:myo-inositol 2-dehydrogenase/D-chiro-inositol 1-dehydrogenase